MSMETLIAVVNKAEKRSLGRSGKEVGLSASAISKRIRAADQTVGAKIFHVTEAGFSLTRHGETFYAEAVQALEHACLAEEKTRAQVMLEQQHLLVGHSTYLASRMLTVLDQLRFEEDPPVHIHHTGGLTRDLVEKVLNGSLHVAFGFLPLSHPELIVHPLYEEPLVVCLPSAHPLAARHTLHVQDLARTPLIAVSREPLPVAHEEIERYCHGFGIQLQIVADAYTPWEAHAYVEHRIGICLLARSSTVTRSGITIKPFATRLLTRKSGMFVREDNR
ncbi:MAG: LysR substrate-binding domain-containing protein, partial [Acidobacteriaceae bacterium]